MIHSKMKNFLIVSLILSIGISIAQAKIKPLEYIELVSFPLEHETELKWIVENIERIPEESPSEEDFAKFFAEAKTQSVNDGDYQKRVVLDAFDRTIPVPNEDASFEAKCFIDVTTVAFGGFGNFISLVRSKKLPEKSRKLFTYLKDYGLEKWSNCLGKDNLQSAFFSTLNKLDKVAEETFDKLLKTNEKFPSEGKLASAVEKVDFVRGKLDGKHMMNSMKAYLEEFKPNIKTTSTMLVNFIRQLCDKMYPTLVDFYDRYNLARAISPDQPKTVEEDSPTFKKLHEYARLCIQVLDSATSKIAAEKIEKSVG